jgi:hypothetical protein
MQYSNALARAARGGEEHLNPKNLFTRKKLYDIHPTRAKRRIGAGGGIRTPIY